MINSFPKYFSRRFYQQGAATLVFSIILLTLSTLIILFAAAYNNMQQKTNRNALQQTQAFEAAEAGLEFGISYLTTNATTILANPVSGYINYSDSNTTNVTLQNNSKFTVTYSNPVANNYTIIRITSLGTNEDNTATRTISEEVAFGSLLAHYSNTALSSKGTVAVSGNGNVTNTITNNTIAAASSVTFSGSGNTTTSGLGSNSSQVRSDVQANQSYLSNMSQNDFFANYFGTTNMSTIKTNIVNYYSNSSNTNYSSLLNGKNGTSIWIDQTNGSTATINGNTTIGSIANPVLLIINGNFSLSGNVNIYGFIFVIGASGITTLTGNITIYGGLATSDNLTISGNSSLVYDTTILSNLQNLNTMRYYARIPGSWKDF